MPGRGVTKKGQESKGIQVNRKKAGECATITPFGSALTLIDRFRGTQLAHPMTVE